ncbi:MAG TPA: hypothetical protein VGI75_10755 [Pirellulales bacterium]|jgi:hypothetical protein
MSDSLLHKYTNRRFDLDASAAEDADGFDDLGAFGWLRGQRERAIMLQLRLKTGNIVSLGYSWLERAEFDASEGITLRFGGQSVKLLGRNLNAEVRQSVRLFDGLVRHRVPWIQEADGPALLRAGAAMAVVEQVRLDG